MAWRMQAFTFPRKEESMAIRTLVGKGFAARDRVKDLLRAPGPCVSIFLPAYAPGGGARPDAIWLRHALDEVRGELVRHHIPEPQVQALLDPLETRAGSEQMEKGHNHGAAWFATEAGLEEFDLPDPAGRGWAVGQQPFLLPLLGALTQPAEFYVLGLAKHGLKLFRCAEGECVESLLPEDMPTSIEEMLAFDQPDHLRSNRTPAAAVTGVPAGKLRTVRFGTGDEAETADRYLHQFLRHVDARIGSLLAGKAAPVVLAGVGYEVNEFFRLTQGMDVVRESFVEGAWKDLALGELYAKASGVLRSRYNAQVRELTSRLKETANRVETLCRRKQSRDLASAVAAGHGGESHRRGGAEQGRRGVSGPGQRIAGRSHRCRHPPLLSWVKINRRAQRRRPAGDRLAERNLE
jgi:hypothetical protein